MLKLLKDFKCSKINQQKQLFKVEIFEMISNISPATLHTDLPYHSKIESFYQVKICLGHETGQGKEV